MKRTRTSIIIFLIFFCFDCLVASAISEVWIRSFIPVANICYYHDPTLGDMFCPHQKTYGYVEEGYANPFINNSLGFHDIERKKEKDDSLLRIHVYGDSMIAGAGVPIEKTIPSLLEFYINKSAPNQVTEVVNMASAEDSTGSEYLIYQHIGQQFSPDVVIVYFMNDFHDNIIETHPRTRSPFFKIATSGKLYFVPPKPVDTSSLWERFKRWSRLYRLLANKFLSSQLYHNITQQIRVFSLSTKKVKNKQSASLSAAEKRRQFLRDKAWPVTTELLKQFRDKVEKDGAEFILVDGFPISPTSAGGYLNSNLEAFCKKNAITYIPMYQEYDALKKDANASKYFLKDGHPTVIGNETLTEILSRKLSPVLHLPAIETTVNSNS